MGGSQTWFENAKPISRAYCFRTRCRRGRSFCVRYKKEMFLKDSGGSGEIFAKIVKDLRIGSLVGRAPALHAGGHRFESCPVHHLIRHFARSAFFCRFSSCFLGVSTGMGCLSDRAGWCGPMCFLEVRVGIAYLEKQIIRRLV